MTKEKIDVMKVAALARLRVSENEALVLEPQLVRILSHIATLDELETKEIDPTGGVGLTSAPLGDDHPHVATKQSEVLSQAPEHLAGQFAVPRFVDN